jgi:hypothetical protein
MWQVTLTKPPSPGIFREGFFPRKIHYKRDAETLVEEVRTHKGDAEIEKVRKEKKTK